MPFRYHCDVCNDVMVEGQPAIRFFLTKTETADVLNRGYGHEVVVSHLACSLACIIENLNISEEGRDLIHAKPCP